MRTTLEKKKIKFKYFQCNESLNSEKCLSNQEMLIKHFLFFDTFCCAYFDKHARNNSILTSIASKIIHKFSFYFQFDKKKINPETKLRK